MKQYISYLGLLIFICFSATKTAAQQPTLEWERQYNDNRPGYGNLDDTPAAVAVDTEGNIYVTGTSRLIGPPPPSGERPTPRITTIKYSPTGDTLWLAQYKDNSGARDIAVDNKGGIYVTGSVTIRYDAGTGQQTWVRAGGNAIALDSIGGVYVSGAATARYDAISGKQTWLSEYKGGDAAFVSATGITVDNQGNVFVTGLTGNEGNYDYFTISYKTATGKENWAKKFDSSGDDQATAIAIDNSGGVYVTGLSSTVTGGYNIVTLRYDTITGKRTWLSTIREGEAKDIAVDNQGNVFVTGIRIPSIGNDTGSIYNIVTICYDAQTGYVRWGESYNSPDSERDEPTAIVVDSNEGVYVIGTSNTISGAIKITALKYSASNGSLFWDIQTGGPYEVAGDMALDKEGNIIITGYSFGTETFFDFLTLKYRQEDVCSELTETEITGDATVSSGKSDARYSLTVPGATSFSWQITAPNGFAYTNFTGQGSSSISVDWPREPEMYKVSATYSAGESCPATTSVKYVSVYDTGAGFITGGGWLDSPLSKDYELMQEEGRAYWAFDVRYKKYEGDIIQGTLLLVLESGYTFRATSVKAGSLVITDNRAYFSREGTLTRHDTSEGELKSDERRFAYLVSAVDVDLDNQQGKSDRGKDRLRLVIWEVNEGGSPGKIVYDNQLACSSPETDLNTVACQKINRGSIVIHKQGIHSLNDLFTVSTAEVKPEAQGLLAYPTAFSDKAILSFTLDHDTRYALALYDLKGALVRRIAVGTSKTGQRQEYELSAAGLQKGLYLVHLATSMGTQTVKVVIVK